MTADIQEELNEYEKLRCSNIQERESLFQEVMEAKSKVNKAFARKKVIFRKIDYGPPSRKSRRILKEVIPKVERAPNPLQTLDFKAIFDYGFYDERLKQGEQFFTHFCQELFEINPTKQQLNINEYNSNKNDLQSKTSAVISDPKEHIRSICIHPAEWKILAGAGTMQGDLVLWDVTEGFQSNPSLYKFKPHSSEINCLSWDKFNSHQLITSSFDGTCRILDLNRMESRLLFGNKDFLSLNMKNNYNGPKMNTCDMHQQLIGQEFLISMGRTGCISLVDQRVGHEYAVQEYQVFDAVSAQNISVHPVQDNLVLAANNVGGAFVFDRRNLPGKEDGFCKPVAELVGHEKGITSAAFNSSGNKIATMCIDNKLRLFDSTIIKGSLEGSAADHSNRKIYHNFGFRGVWHPNHEDVYFAGSQVPRQVRAYRATSVMNQIRTYRDYQGDDLKFTCPVLAAHPTLDVLVGGGTKRVQVFM